MAEAERGLMGAPINVKKLLTLILVLIPSLCFGFGVTVVSGGAGSDSAWPIGYDKRIQITIDKDQIDTANQTNFPVMVYLSAASGIGDVDVSAVFDELTSDANRKKIAVTSDDETTELYVEIERWDDANEKAWLHVKVPSVANDADTVLYLYYDKDHADNTSYVGDTTDAVTHNVWDSNFKAVYHMAQDPNGDVADAIKDSTSNAAEQTPYGTMTTADLVDAKIGKGIEFDGSDDRLSTPNDTQNFGTFGVTLEAIFKTADLGTIRVITARMDNDNSYNPYYLLGLNATGNVEFQVRGQDNTTSNVALVSTTADYDDNALRYIAGVFDDPNNSAAFYMNGAADGTVSSKTTTTVDFGTAKTDLAVQYYTPDTTNYYFMTGIIDEVRISSTARSAPWIKATYHSLWDSLVTFGAEETP